MIDGQQQTERSPSDKPWLAALSPDETRRLLAVEDWRGLLSIVIDWTLVAAAFALVAAWPNPIAVVIALFVIGARQLGLAVIMHEGAHRTLLRNPRLNDWVANWLAASPLLLDVVPHPTPHPPP